MQLLIKLEFGVPSGYPIQEDNFRAIQLDKVYPKEITPEDLVGSGYALYNRNPAPGTVWSKKVIEISPVADENGVYQQTYDTIDLDGDELATAIQLRKQQLNDEVNKIRNRQEQAGFTYMGKVIDSDTISVQRITVATQAAQTTLSAGKDIVLVWTTKDNSELTMNAADIIGMSSALAMYGNSVHEYARTLKSQIESQNTVSGLNDIDVTAGWPQQ